MVTHVSTEEKTRSGFKIIEIPIVSEDDVSFLGSGELGRRGPSPAYINFSFKPKAKKIQPRQCNQGSICAFIVRSDGRSALLRQQTFGSLYSLRQDQPQLLNEVQRPEHLAQGYIRLVEKASNLGIHVKNCHLCRYHGYAGKKNHIRTDIFCRYYKRGIDDSNAAATCEVFYRDTSRYWSRQMHSSGPV